MLNDGLIILCRWQKTQFGGHTYVKKMPKGKRPVGATHAGNRPKTAPVTAREKWKTDKVPHSLLK